MGLLDRETTEDCPHPDCHGSLRVETAPTGEILEIVHVEEHTAG